MSGAVPPLPYCHYGVCRVIFIFTLYRTAFSVLIVTFGREQTGEQNILRFNALYISSRRRVSFARVVPKYLNFAAQADRSSYELEIRQMLLFISFLRQPAPSDCCAWPAVYKPRDSATSFGAHLNTIVIGKKPSWHSQNRRFGNFLVSDSSATIESTLRTGRLTFRELSLSLS
jgi:hypothetical protein